MAVIPLLLLLVIVGFVVWVIRLPQVPIDPTFKLIIIGIIVIVALVIILQAFGLLHTGVHF